MYNISIYDNETGYAIEIKLSTQTEVLDFISLLSLSINDHIFISISYERREDTRYDETESHGRV